MVLDEHNSTSTMLVQRGHGAGTVRQLRGSRRLAQPCSVSASVPEPAESLSAHHGREMSRMNPLMAIEVIGGAPRDKAGRALAGGCFRLVLAGSSDRRKGRHEGHAVAADQPTMQRMRTRRAC